MSQLPWISELADDPNKPDKIGDWAMVKVVNLGVEDLRWQYANRTMRIPGTRAPGNNFAVVPYHMMVLYCGDPRTFDHPTDQRRRYRTDEFKRLCVVYGVYENVTGNNADLGTVQNFPKVEVYTIAGDQRIWTVLEDPEGTLSTPPTAQQVAIDDQSQLVALMQRQMAAMQAQLDEMKRQQGMSSNEQTLTAAELENIRVSDSPVLQPEPVDNDGAIQEDEDPDADILPPRAPEPTSGVPLPPGATAVKSAAVNTPGGISDSTEAQMAAALAEGDDSQPYDSDAIPDAVSDTILPAAPMFGK